MSQRGALDPKGVAMLGGFSKMCPCKSVLFSSCWPSFPHYRSGLPGFVTTLMPLQMSLHVVIIQAFCSKWNLRSCIRECDNVSEFIVCI